MLSKKFMPIDERNLPNGVIGLPMIRAMSEFGSIAILAYYILQGPFKGVESASVLIYQYYGYYETES